MKVALGQFAVGRTWQENADICVGLMAQARAGGADLLVLPEGVLTRYIADPDIVLKSAQPLDGPFMARLLEATRDGERVQIFFGADNPLFSMTGCSIIVAPYGNSRERVVGAIGVIGPTRINYARIIPLVDYTAKVVGRLLG